MMISSPTISPSVMHAKRVVIKVGSALIAPNRTGCEKKYLLPIAQLSLNYMSTTFKSY